LVSQSAKGRKILDFGCGTGEFLTSLKDKWNIYGVEPSAIARKKATEQTQKIIAENLPEKTERDFDIVTLWHVIEHVPDLNETIAQLVNKLKNNGVLLLAVPNYEAPDALKYGSDWAGYDVPRHLWHFSKKSMSTLLEKHNLKLVEIKGMKLDAYYVSMLSEKYKNSNKQTLVTFLNGVLSGALSNLKAKGNNYSSLIYIAERK
jgi:2-polyprenyl-3-methyl-5-hydroxy-6-metoxy-1,4-benzoquinol methylase